jgi:spore coat protein CotH
MYKPLLAAILFWVVSPGFSQTGNQFFSNDKVHEIRMYSNDPDLWQALLTHYDESQAGGENVYNPVDVVIDGTPLSTVGLRIKGFSSAWGTQGRKKPFRLDFNEFISGQSYDGLKKISLNNAWVDNSVMRDVIAYDIFRTAGLAASRTSYAKVYINEEYFGLYIVAEQIDKTFLKSRFEDGDGNLYKCIGWSDLTYLGTDKNAYKSSLELKTNESEDDWSRFIEFVKYANKFEISDQQYAQEFPEKFDIDGYFKVLAIDILLQNWDSYYDHGRNFYIYDNPSTGQMTWIPWDYNLSFSATSIDILASQIFGTQKPLIRNLLNDPENVNRLVRAYEGILEDNFTIERLAPLIDQTKQLIREEVENDPNYTLTIEQFDASLEETISIHHEDTVVFMYDMEQIHIISDWSHYPPGTIMYHDKLLVDTTAFLDSHIETIDFGAGPKEFLYARQIWIYDEMVIGLKGFIRDRIAKVKDEIAKLGSVTAIEPDEVADSFVISPNPSSDKIRFSGSITDRPFDVAVFDTNGKQIPLVRRGNEMDVRDLPPGLYVLRVRSSSGTLSRKFLRASEEAK